MYIITCTMQFGIIVNVHMPPVNNNDHLTRAEREGVDGNSSKLGTNKVTRGRASNGFLATGDFIYDCWKFAFLCVFYTVTILYRGNLIHRGAI